jgi:hypothetical protein
VSKWRCKVATQRITVTKVGGMAAEVVMLRLHEWASARQTDDPTEWASEQWSLSVRSRADAFADRLRSQALAPPVVYFAEWADLWSMGDLFTRMLAPPGGPAPSIIHADRFEIYGYGLPDGGLLIQHLASVVPQQFTEYNWFVRHLQEAVRAWQELVEQATIVVLREVVGGLVTDDELSNSLSRVPDWLSDFAVSDLSRARRR